MLTEFKMNDEDVEVQRLKSLVKDLELQNTALRSQKQHEHRTSPSANAGDGCGGTAPHVTRRSISSDEDDFFDLSSMSALDDDVSWLYSPSKSQSSPKPSADDLKRKMLSVLESPEVLPRRRALSHKLRDIEKVPPASEGVSPNSQSLFPLRNLSSSAQSQDFGVLSSSHPNSSLNNSFNSSSDDGGYYTTAHLPTSPGSSYNNGANSYYSSANDTSPLFQDSPPPSSSNPPYSTGTFTRPKKNTAPLAQSHSAHDNGAESGEPLPAAADSSLLVNVQPPTPSSDSADVPSLKSDERAAGDSSTFVRRRNQTRTIENSAVLEAQRLLTDSPSTVEQGDGDTLGSLPTDESFRRRVPTGNHEDKNKRESLDIQTLAKLQEQSLRDSLSAVRKASTSSSTGSGGVPGLNFSDLDSSNGSLSSSNEESYHQYAENKALQGSGTFRIRKSPRPESPSAPSLELNGDTPILHKSVVSSRNISTPTGSGRKSPQIRSSLSPRSIQAPKSSGLRKPSALPGPSKPKPRTGGIPTPRSGLRPPTHSPYSNR